VREVGGDAGDRRRDVVEAQLRDARGELEEERERLADAAGGAEERDVEAARRGGGGRDGGRGRERGSRLLRAAWAVKQ
jgi:hypothetical protein